MNSNDIESASENDVEFDELLPKDSAPLNLETLNSDCQQHILDYFEIKDLLNVAETSKTLHAAACVAFKRKYGQRNVVIGLYSTGYSDKFYEKYFANGKGIDIRLNPHPFKFLRNFGCTLSSLTVMRRPYGIKDPNRIPLYVIKYCSKSIQTLQIRHCLELTQCIFEPVDNPFTNLKHLTIEYCRYKSKSWTFDGAVFPNLQTLKFHMNRMDSMDSPKIEFKTLPALKYFSFECTRSQNNNTMTGIIDMIKLNTQLEKFEIALLEQFDEATFDALMQSLKCLPNLQRLNLIFSGPKSVFNSLDAYHFNNVTDFGLFNVPYTFSVKIPFTFNKLKRFIITAASKTFSEHLSHAHIWDFLATNKHLTSIFLHGTVYSSTVNGSLITKYAHVFSNVEELYIHKCEDIPIDIVFGLLKNRLRKFKIIGAMQPIERNSDDISDILNYHKIEFKSKGPYLWELFIKSNTNSSLINCFIDCASAYCGNYFVHNIEIYSKDELECYMPLIHPYYSKHYATRHF